MMRALSALALFATASAVPDIASQHAGVVVGHMQELNLEQVIELAGLDSLAECVAGCPRPSGAKLAD